MRKSVFRWLCTLLLLAVVNSAGAQQNTGGLNLDFEQVEKGMPAGLSVFGGEKYKVSLDSGMVYSGKYAVCLQSPVADKAADAPSGFVATSFVIPNYVGKSITLSGYVRTENVEGGYAGLWMRIDPGVGFDNMADRGISGTKGWTKMEITLSLNPEKTTQIVLGGILSGKGKMWIDSLEIKVDGKAAAGTVVYEREKRPAELDREFDEGSLIADFTPDKRQQQDLYLLGLIWGYVKYYHPNVAAGNVNMDYELFRVLPEVLRASSGTERDAMLEKWLDRLGEYKTTDSIKTVPGEVKLLPDLTWITSSGFTSGLTQRLQRLKEADRKEENYYVKLSPFVGNPVFNETPYKQFSYPDTGFRFLALYRYWNMIQYFYPNRHLIGRDWKEVLQAFIPQFVGAADVKQYTLAAMKLISSINDSHGVIFGTKCIFDIYGGNRLPVAEISFVENRAVVTGYYNDSLSGTAVLKPGDIVTRVNGVPVDKVVESFYDITPASNEAGKLRNIASKMMLTNDSILPVEFKRNGRKHSAVLPTHLPPEIYVRKEIPDPAFRMREGNIAYINHGVLKIADLPEIWEQMKDARGLIIDIRNYPAEFSVYHLAAYLMPAPRLFVRFAFCRIPIPGAFYFTTGASAGKKRDDFFKGKVVILVNETTQSQAEFTAMAYRQAPGAVVMGSTTAGADGNVSGFVLPGNICTYISGIGIYTPEGGETQRVGVIPDIVVRPTIKGIQEGRDEILEHAVSLIQNGK